MTAELQSAAVWSPKGGVGKSVLAASLAFKLAERAKTVLVDGNPDNPDLVTLLQCPGLPNISVWPNPTRDQLELAFVSYSDRLWVLPGPPRYVEEHTCKGETMESILQSCLQAEMKVVVDLGTSLRDSTIVALDMVDLILVPVTMDLLSLAPLKRLAKELDLLRLPKNKFRVVVNRHTSTPDITLDDIREFVDFPVMGTVASSKELAGAVNRGEVARALSGTGPLGKGMAPLAASFFAVEETGSQKGKASPNGWFRLRRGAS
jgi:MinD-like ATPase involved in chromosome partitioning or flagellar assembly